MTTIDAVSQPVRTVPGVSLDVVLGPMKSGKSLSLISMLSPLQFTRVRHRVYQSERHVRDTGVTSRSGGELVTTKVATLREALAEPLEVVAVDEVHMFGASDVAVIEQLLARGTRVVVAGIDLDHRGELFATVRALLELGPDTVAYRRAVCDRCRDFSATHTQVLRSGEPFLEHLGGSEALPDDGTFSYEARCRSCFVRPARS
ncbi:thymidine kinase [Terrabacter sp. NPDC080008]|uniref:thymidine kinase n=1 Tax=Terrabacter sp. NPDC080008 TaxID=3155176 RepID=UPI00344CA8F8